MAWQEFQSFNQTDLAGLFLYPAGIKNLTTGQVGIGFIPMILFALFVIVLFSTFFTQKRFTGREDFFASFATAGFFTAVIALIMTLVDGLINNYTLTFTVVIAIIGVILLFFSRDR